MACRGVARWWLGRPGWRQDLHDAVAMARRSDPATLARVVACDLRFGDVLTGCFGPMTPRCARARRRCRPPKGPATISHWAWPSTRWGSRCCIETPRRTVTAGWSCWCRPAKSGCAASSLPGPGRRVVGRPGGGQARRPRCCHSGDAPSRGRDAPGRTALLWRLGHRRSGGDAAGAWRRGRPGRSRGGDRPVGERCRQTTVRRCARSRCCDCARC